MASRKETFKVLYPINIGKLKNQTPDSRTTNSVFTQIS
ncbi:hypothetical protein QE357_000066 [Siphonobacter sp. BAB-5404]|nr:hypothetical protein [Siphonobacter sp. SORGH_AS_0500]